MRTLIARSRFLVVPFALLATTACQRSVSSTVGSTSSSFGVTAPVSGPEARDTNALAAAPPAATSLPALDSPKTFAAAPPPPARPAASAVAAAADPGSALKDMEARSDDRRSVVHAKASFGSGALASATVPLSIAPGPHAMSAEPYGGAFNSGPIAAGEWDDNANYRDFMRYLSNEESLPLHRVDVSDPLPARRGAHRTRAHGDGGLPRKRGDSGSCVHARRPGRRGGSSPDREP
jgi:hypothetical protein